MNYTHSGTVLPGYTPGVGFLGSRPSLGFILVVKMMFVTKRQRWLTNYPDFNQNFSQTNKVFKATANVDLFPDLKLI
jgi:hypothetical protein